MPTVIGLDRTRELLADGAQLVDALFEDTYAELHIPGAINIPTRKIASEAPSRLSKDRPVVVYCHDFR